MRSLNFGYGKENHLKDYEGAELKDFDFNVFPYPYLDETFGRIYARMVLEHLEEPYKVLEDLYRIMKPDGELTIIVPHFTSAGAHNPLHLHFFDSNTMDFVSKTVIKEKGIMDYGFKCDFEILEVNLHFSKGMQLWNYVIEWVANIKPEWYEGTPLRIFPCTSIKYKLRMKR